MVGAGVIGLATAWQLQRHGHAVTLVDPRPPGPQEAGSGSSAALGLLMAQVFHRNRGRAWQLRQRSLDLWQHWRHDLDLPWRPGLLLLAASEEEAERQRRLVTERQALGMPLSWWPAERLAALTPALPGAGRWGALHSAADGQIDPPLLLERLRRAFRAAGGNELADRAVAIEAAAGADRWRLRLAAGGDHRSAWLVLAAGLGNDALLPGLGGSGCRQEPVLGQALELQLPAGLTAEPWPGSLCWQGINLVPRAAGRLWLGATLEPGRRADPEALTSLQQLNGAAPPWLLEATVLRQWQGLRSRPTQQPAPVLEEPEPGLLVLAGAYRNGVLLAPACATWAQERISGGFTCSR
ncbi:MAG: FAD-binding oxidoreductase [Synechococcus sp. Tobar2m-G35]|nr:FAD-binding oxidoreductase [Synechococcus sp. Tobar2m-G35]